MRRGVVPRLGIHGEQESKGQHEEPKRGAGERAVTKPDQVELLGEDEVDVLVVAGYEREEGDDHGDTKHMPANRNVVEKCQKPVAEDVHQRVEQKDEDE